MTWYYNCPAIVELNGQNGPGDMKLKMSLSLGETADTTKQVSVLAAIEVGSSGTLLATRHSNPTQLRR
jgi:hypothetical protein